MSYFVYPGCGNAMCSGCSYCYLSKVRDLETPKVEPLKEQPGEIRFVPADNTDLHKKITSLEEQVSNLETTNKVFQEMIKKLEKQLKYVGGK